MCYATSPALWIPPYFLSPITSLCCLLSLLHPSLPIALLFTAGWHLGFTYSIPLIFIRPSSPYILCVFKEPCSMWPTNSTAKISISMLFVTFSCLLKCILSILPIIRLEAAFKKSFCYRKLVEVLDKYLMMVMLIHYNIQNENKAISSSMQCKSPLYRFIATEIAFM